MAVLGRQVHRAGPHLLEVGGNRGNPVFAALEAVGSAESAPLVAATAHKDTHTAIVVWQRPQLIIIETRDGNRWWRQFRLNVPMQSLRSLATSKDLPTPPTARGTGDLPDHLNEIVTAACRRLRPDRAEGAEGTLRLPRQQSPR